MHFGLFIKQFISFFIQPFGLVVSLFTLGLYCVYTNKERSAKFFLSMALFLLLLFSSAKFANFLVSGLEDRYHKYDYKERVAYIHVLGSGHNTDAGQPLSSHLGSASLKRVLEGVLIYKRTPHARLIFTGYEGDTDMSNASMNAKLALALGVKKEDIILGEEALDTKDEARFCKSVVGDKPFVLVTSATHMPRAMGLFHAEGLDPIAAPTDFLREEVGYLKAPDVSAFVKSQRAMHEYIGILWSKLRE